MTQALCKTRFPINFRSSLKMTKDKEDFHFISFHKDLTERNGLKTNRTLRHSMPSNNIVDIVNDLKVMKRRSCWALHRLRIFLTENSRKEKNIIRSMKKRENFSFISFRFSNKGFI